MGLVLGTPVAAQKRRRKFEGLEMVFVSDVDHHLSLGLLQLKLEEHVVRLQLFLGLVFVLFVQIPQVSFLWNDGGVYYQEIGDLLGLLLPVDLLLRWPLLFLDGVFLLFGVGAFDYATIFLGGTLLQLLGGRSLLLGDFVSRSRWLQL